MSPDKPREKEEEYFLRIQAQQLMEQAEKVRQSKAAEELERLKELHWMRCPKCGMELTEITYRTVKIDECFSCGGMYLDAGELEQVAAREGVGGVLYGLTTILRAKGKKIDGAD
jgi:Zn-finger nucleic acid-binding protein